MQQLGTTANFQRAEAGSVSQKNPMSVENSSDNQGGTADNDPKSPENSKDSQGGSSSQNNPQSERNSNGNNEGGSPNQNNPQSGGNSNGNKQEGSSNQNNDQSKEKSDGHQGGSPNQNNPQSGGNSNGNKQEGSPNQNNGQSEEKPGGQKEDGVEDKHRCPLPPKVNLGQKARYQTLCSYCLSVCPRGSDTFLSPSWSGTKGPGTAFVKLKTIKKPTEQELIEICWGNIVPLALKSSGHCSVLPHGHELGKRPKVISILFTCCDSGSSGDNRGSRCVLSISASVAQRPSSPQVPCLSRSSPSECGSCWHGGHMVPSLQAFASSSCDYPQGHPSHRHEPSNVSAKPSTASVSPVSKNVTTTTLKDIGKSSSETKDSPASNHGTATTSTPFATSKMITPVVSTNMTSTTLRSTPKITNVSQNTSQVSVSTVPTAHNSSSSVTVTTTIISKENKGSKFDTGSFVGGIVLTLGVLSFLYIGCKVYYSRRGIRYRTIDEHDAII
nr:PREDICTED: porimin [Bos mutus]